MGTLGSTVCHHAGKGKNTRKHSSFAHADISYNCIGLETASDWVCNQTGSVLRKQLEEKSLRHGEWVKVTNPETGKVEEDLLWSPMNYDAEHFRQYYIEAWAAHAENVEKGRSMGQSQAGGLLLRAQAPEATAAPAATATPASASGALGTTASLGTVPAHLPSSQALTICALAAVQRQHALEAENEELKAQL